MAISLLGINAWPRAQHQRRQSIFIARQHAMYADCDIVLASPSVRPSVQCRHCI